VPRAGNELLVPTEAELRQWNKILRGAFGPLRPAPAYLLIRVTRG